jgi:hypothetical protein
MLNIIKDKFIFVTLCSPIFIEIIRRFIDSSNFLIMIFDVLIWISYLIYFKKIRKFYHFILLLIIAMVAINITFTHQSILYGYIGARIILIFILTITIVSIYMDDINKLSKLLNIYIIFSSIITIYALMQLVLGVNNEINILPEGVISDQNMGIGFTGDETEYLDYFRPTSIFFHTGKYGQMSYFLMIIPIYIVIKLKIINIKSLISLLSGFISLIIAGQKAAIIGVLLYLIISLNKTEKYKIIIFILLIAFFINEFSVIKEIYNILIYNRIEQSYEQAAGRLHEQVFYPLENMNFLEFMGKGIGSTKDYLLTNTSNLSCGFSENSLIIILCEWGWLNFIILYLLTFLALIKYIYFSKYLKLNSFDVLILLTIIWLSLWSYTHNIVGNYITMYNLGLLIGISISIRKYKYIKF